MRSLNAHTSFRSPGPAPLLRRSGRRSAFSRYLVLPLCHGPTRARASGTRSDLNRRRRVAPDACTRWTDAFLPEEHAVVRSVDDRLHEAHAGRVVATTNGVVLRPVPRRLPLLCA